MTLEWALPLVAGIVALAISIVLFRMYLHRKKIHHALWALGMLLWAVSDFTQLYAIVAAWTVPIYLSYFFGSIMLAGFLGAGTLYLVAPNSRISYWYMWFNVACAVVLAVLLVISPVNTSALQTAVVGANAITAVSVGILAAIVNIPALVTFAGGALYSFVRTWKLYALLIALGAIIPAVGGTFATASIPELLPFTDFFGILLLGAGFFLSFNSKPIDKKK